MKEDRAQFWPLSRHKLLLLLSMLLAAGFVWIDIRIVVLLWGAHLLLILIAPYFARLSFFLPVLTRSRSSTGQISITFDDGPDPELTGPLLDLLARYRIKACFFVVGQKAEQHPELIRRMVAEGHDIGNHSMRHDSLLMLKPGAILRKEIADCQTVLLQQGIKSFAFRPPVGITNPKLFSILLMLGLYCVGFSCRPRDFGNRRIKRLSRKVLTQIRAGDILLLHDKKPSSAFSSEIWLTEIEAILRGLREMNLEVVPLSRLLNRPVSQVAPPLVDEPSPKLIEVLSYVTDCDDLIYRYHHFPLQAAEEDAFPALLFEPERAIMEIDGVTTPLAKTLNPDLKAWCLLVSSPSRKAYRNHTLPGQRNQAPSVKNRDELDQSDWGNYDLIVSPSGLFFEQQLDRRFQQLAELLRPNGVLYFLMPANHLRGRLFSVRLALRTGLRTVFHHPGEISNSLKQAGFSVSRSEPIPSIFKRGFIAYTAIKSV